MGAKIAFIIVTACCIGVWGEANAHAESIRGRESQIKAAYLYNFVRFVAWPDKALDNTQISTICVLGQDPIARDLNAFAGKTVKGRTIAVRPIETVEAAAGCHIVFIGASEHKRLAQILATLSQTSLLTVGQMKRFTHRGGMINFVVNKNKVRLEINVEAATQVGLKISGHLLNLARVVQSESHKGKN